MIILCGPAYALIFIIFQLFPHNSIYWTVQEFSKGKIYQNIDKCSD